ncbi:MAG TPA: L-threonylcarbamoyladenylate synthase [Candidatus Binataceae bacterium]|nr:L-threonylcarbamoyladenylate synthase [Candidatus Binataceae bacterium]
MRSSRNISESERGAPPLATIDTALAALREGEAIVFPTETFYGVAVDAMNPRALKRLFEIKERDPDKPVALIAADLEMVARVVSAIPPHAIRLAREFWPGPLTIVLPARAELSSTLTNREGGVGIRVSPHPIALELTRRLGSPLTATSANLAGEPPARTLAQAWAAFGTRIAAYLDGGTLDAALPSTVIAFENGRIKVLRAGAIPEFQLRRALDA